MKGELKMELKVNIPDSTYEELKKENSLPFSKIHELFDAIKNGMPTTVSTNDINKFECILNKEEADIFNSLSNEQKEVVCKLLDNAARQAEEKDKDNKLLSKKEIDDHAEVCRLMTEYLGRKFDQHEAEIIALYRTIQKNKEMFTEVKGEDKIIVKLAVRSLLD